MKQITINGKQYSLNCTFRTILSYQRISGCNPLDIEHMTAEQKAMYDVTMGWCMLPDSDQEELPIDKMMAGIDTVSKQAEFSAAVAAELQRYYEIKPGDADPTDRNDLPDSEESQEETKKNS